MPVNVHLRFHPLERLATVGITDNTRLDVCYRTRRGVYEYEGKSYDIETIYFYYTKNPALGCWGTYINPKSDAWGYHDHDVEKVTILYQPGTEHPVYVYFSAHGVGQGMWMEWTRCEKTIDNHLVVYVARSSHACYPTPEVRCRIFGFANDYCSNKGRWVNLTALNAFDWTSPNGIVMTSDPIRPPRSSIGCLGRFCATFFWKK